MTPNERADANASLERQALPVLLLAASLALAWILVPFYGTILWGAVIAMMASPLHRRLLPRVHGRRTTAALLTLLIVLVVVVLPFALVSAALAREGLNFYERVQLGGAASPTRYFRDAFNALPDWITSLLDRFGLVNFATLQRRLSAALETGAQFMAGQALDLGQNTLEWLLSGVVTMYLAFFLIRDGDRIVLTVRRALPLTSLHKQELLDKFTTVIRATVKGNLLVAAVQGALGGIAFWFLDVRGALLWAVLMAFLSLLPAVGAAVVWLPVALYFLLIGATWQALALTAWGVLVIGLVDNLLRPMLVGKDTRMPDYVVLISTLGGMSVFGINGFVLGPVIAAMFIAVWHLYVTTRRDLPG